MREFSSPPFPPVHPPVHPPTQPSTQPSILWNDVEKLTFPMYQNLYGQNYGAIAQALGTKTAAEVEEYCRQMNEAGPGEAKEEALESHARIAARLGRGESAVPPSTPPTSVPHVSEGDTSERHNPYRISPRSESVNNSEMTGSSIFSSYARPDQNSYRERPYCETPSPKRHRRL